MISTTICVAVLDAMQYSISALHNRRQLTDRENVRRARQPMSITTRLIEVGVTDVDVLCAAALYVSIGAYSHVTVAQIAQTFGQKIARIVGEVTAHKSLKAVASKKAQLRAAKTMSFEGKLVVLAKKLDNCIGIAAGLPFGWSPKEAQGCLCWTAALLDELVGTHAVLEEKLKAILAGTFAAPHYWVASVYPCTLTEPDRATQLQNYYNILHADENAPGAYVLPARPSHAPAPTKISQVSFAELYPSIMRAESIDAPDGAASYELD